MTDEARDEREEHAFEALVVSAFHRIDIDDDVDVQALQKLTPKEEAVLASLGSDFMKRLIAGKVQPSTAANDCEEIAELVGTGDGHGFLNRATKLDETSEEEVRKKREEIRKRKRSERARSKKETHG